MELRSGLPVESGQRQVGREDEKSKVRSSDRQTEGCQGPEDGIIEDDFWVRAIPTRVDVDAPAQHHPEDAPYQSNVLLPRLLAATAPLFLCFDVKTSTPSAAASEVKVGATAAWVSD